MAAHGRVADTLGPHARPRLSSAHNAHAQARHEERPACDARGVDGAPHIRGRVSQELTENPGLLGSVAQRNRASGGDRPAGAHQEAGNLCVFTGQRPGHYKPALTIQIVPWSKKLFSVAERDAVQSATREHEQFGVVSRALKVGKKAFFVSGTTTSASLPPCGSEEAPAPSPLEIRTGPICAGEPALTHITVIGYGPSPSGVELMVSAGGVAQQGDISLIHVITR